MEKKRRRRSLTLRTMKVAIVYLDYSEPTCARPHARTLTNHAHTRTRIRRHTYAGDQFDCFVPGVYQCTKCSAVCEARKLGEHVCDIVANVVADEDEGDEGDDHDESSGTPPPPLSTTHPRKHTHQ